MKTVKTFRNFVLPLSITCLQVAWFLGSASASLSYNDIAPNPMAGLYWVGLGVGCIFLLIPIFPIKENRTFPWWVPRIGTAGIVICIIAASFSRNIQRENAYLYIADKEKVLPVSYPSLRWDCWPITSQWVTVAGYPDDFTVNYEYPDSKQQLHTGVLHYRIVHGPLYLKLLQERADAGLPLNENFLQEQVEEIFARASNEEQIARATEYAQHRYPGVLQRVITDKQ